MILICCLFLQGGGVWAFDLGCIEVWKIKANKIKITLLVMMRSTVVTRPITGDKQEINCGRKVV